MTYFFYLNYTFFNNYKMRIHDTEAESREAIKSFMKDMKEKAKEHKVNIIGGISSCDPNGSSASYFSDTDCTTAALFAACKAADVAIDRMINPKTGKLTYRSQP